MSSGWSWDPENFRVLSSLDANTHYASVINETQHSHALPAAAIVQQKGDENAPPRPHPAAKTSSQAGLPAAPPSVPKSNKRKSDVIQAPKNLPEISDDDPRLSDIDKSCNQIRSMIRRLIESGAMKVGEFQKAIDVSSVTYSRFMNLNGPDKGNGSMVYPAAFAFFKKRELQGLKPVPTKKDVAASQKAKAEAGSGDGAIPAKKARKSEGSAAKNTKAKAAEQLDVSGVTLEGEDEGNVPVYETCDEIRKKLRAFLKKDGVTQAAFCREICKTPVYEDRAIQPRQLSAFLGKQGPTSGNTSPVFYCSYVFLEKLRVKEGKPKGKFRLEMEEIYNGKGGKDTRRTDKKPGFNTTDQLDGPMWMRDDEYVSQDKYGQMEIIKLR